MKILIIRNFPSYMDIRHRTYNIQELGLAKALVRRGNTCGIVFWTDREEEQVDYDLGEGRHIQIYYKKGKSMFHNTVFPHIENIVKEYDIIQSGEYNQLESWLLAKRHPGKVIVYHGPYYSEYNKKYHAMCRVFDLFFLKTYLKNHTQFIVKSHLAEQFLMSKGILQENIRTLGVGIDTDALETCEEEFPDYICDAENSESVIRLLYIGHLDPGRNILFILETLKAVRDKGHAVVLNLVGTGEKEYTEKCRNYIKANKLDRNIHYVKMLEQKYLSRLYQRSDFFLLPTRYDIFGMVLLEAMYYGLAVLTTVNGGSGMMIEHGRNGFCLMLDAGEWAKRIIMLHSDKKMLRRIKQSARKTVAGQFTWDALVPLFLEQYERVLEKKAEDWIWGYHDESEKKSGL